ncbi:MAG: hypothetical protein IPJ88_16725 [Myxococcales bacterium]|nr:MAG: hypothetical protein IPJ88_16725 [Myxococcales bacterium]
MKKPSKFMFFMFGAAMLGACGKSNSEKSVASQVVETKQPESAHVYTVQGDVVHVNNETCAMSGSPLDKKDLGKFQSRVTYDGPVAEYQGKTLVFNQCCEMCIKNFPEKWAKERDDIMRTHGLLSLDSVSRRIND